MIGRSVWSLLPGAAYLMKFRLFKQKQDSSGFIHVVTNYVSGQTIHTSRKNNEQTLRLLRKKYGGRVQLASAHVSCLSCAYTLFERLCRNNVDVYDALYEVVELELITAYII